MPSPLSAITADLIRFKSIDAPGSRDEVKRVMAYVVGRLRKLSGVFVEQWAAKGNPVLMITFRPRHKQPTLLLHGHLDVVPAEESQFSPKQRSGRLYGRGAMDMKGGCAVMIALIEHFAKQSKRPDVGFIFVGDEETTGAGAQFVLKKGIRPGFFVTVEPTAFELITETKGILWMEGVIPGKAAHGSMPWLGKNPVERFHQNLKKFYASFPPLKKKAWKTTCNIGMVKSGDCPNRTPADFTFDLDIRYLPEDDPKKIMQRIKACFPGAAWKVRKFDPPHQKPWGKKWIQRIQRAGRTAGVKIRTGRAPYATDARFFSAAGVDSVVLGATGKNMHGKDEWVDVKSLETLFAILKNILRPLGQKMIMGGIKKVNAIRENFKIG